MMTPEQKAYIDGLCQEQMARIWRFSPVGNEIFIGESGIYFQKRFNELGGMTPEISKRIGWEI